MPKFAPPGLRAGLFLCVVRWARSVSARDKTLARRAMVSTTALRENELVVTAVSSVC